MGIGVIHSPLAASRRSRFKRDLHLAVYHGKSQRARKLRVLFLTNGLRVGGSEKLLVEIVNRIDLTRIKPTIASIDADIPLASAVSPGRAELRVFPRRWRYDLTPASKIRKLIVENEIDAIVPFALFDYFFSKVATLGFRRPPRTYIYIHSTAPPSRKWYIQDWIYSRLLGNTERFISVCDVQADYWAKTYGIPREKFTTLYGGVDVNYFKDAPALHSTRNIREEYGLPPDAKVILQVAHFMEHKRQEDAIRALKIALHSSKRELFLALVGAATDERLSKLKSLARETGMADRVLFCGVQSDVRPYYLAADVFTLTSSSVETFPLSALEAMAMGLPCVLTDVGGVREMIVEGENGYLVKPCDPESIAKGWLLALDRQHAFDRAQIRKRVVDKFSIEKMISDWESLLLETNSPGLAA